MPNYKVLVVDDDCLVRGAIRDYLEAKGYSVSEADTGSACRRSLEVDRPDAVFMDYSLPDTNGIQLLQEVHRVESGIPVIIMTGHGTIELAVRAMKEGAEQFVTKPIELSVLLQCLEKSLESRRYERKEQAGKARLKRYDRDPFWGKSDCIRHLQDTVQRIVGTDCPILIHGETGTGKGVLADWLHKNGPRVTEAFVDLNCAGLNRELLESDLFGHEKGAFTGAVSRKMGLLEVAHRGTMFLDEIGDMDLAIQPKLLKVLDEKRYRRVGDVRDRTVDVHLIAASHQNVSNLVADGKFRADLYFRVNTIPIQIPSLRDRVVDIPILAEWFLERLQHDLGRGHLHFGDGVMDLMLKYHWPGNIRELRNVLERAALLCQGGVICREDLKFQLVKQDIRTPFATEGDLTIEELVQRHIARVLQQENGKVDKAAAKLGIHKSSLYAKIKQYHFASAR
jgi:DNA-binding NtrC family response regulator